MGNKMICEKHSKKYCGLCFRSYTIKYEQFFEMLEFFERYGYKIITSLEEYCKISNFKIYIRCEICKFELYTNYSKFREVNKSCKEHHIIPRKISKKKVNKIVNLEKIFKNPKYILDKSLKQEADDLLFSKLEHKTKKGIKKNRIKEMTSHLKQIDSFKICKEAICKPARTYLEEIFKKRPYLFDFYKTKDILIKIEKIFYRRNRYLKPELSVLLAIYFYSIKSKIDINIIDIIRIIRLEIEKFINETTFRINRKIVLDYLKKNNVEF
jgi:hypothetical protein